MINKYRPTTSGARCEPGVYNVKEIQQPGKKFIGLGNSTIPEMIRYGVLI
jgi:hypothetical protein